MVWVDRGLSLNRIGEGGGEMALRLEDVMTGGGQNGGKLDGPREGEYPWVIKRESGVKRKICPRKLVG